MSQVGGEEAKILAEVLPTKWGFLSKQILEGCQDRAGEGTTSPLQKTLWGDSAVVIEAEAQKNCPPKGATLDSK